MVNLYFYTQLMNKHFKLSHNDAVELSPKLYSVSAKYQKGRLQWPRGLRHGSAAAHLLRLQVQILPREWQVQVSVTG